MPTQVEKVKQVREPASDIVERREVREVTNRTATGSSLVARILGYVAGVLEVLLAFRFVLALLGANPANGFANFIYSASHPFVSPFFSLFGYNLQYGVSKFEAFTLVAMAVYAIIAFGIVKLVTINHPE